VCVRRQGGYAVLALAVVIVTIAAAVVVGWSTTTTVAQANGLRHAQRAYLLEVRAQVEAWYERELAQVDRDVPAPDPRQVLREAGIAPRWGLRVAISDRLMRDGVAHRVFAAWLPVEGDTSAFDVSTGRFTPSANTQWVSLSGFDLQARALADTRSRLARAARQLEAGYRARLLADPGRDVTVNRFRAASCAAPMAGEIPCIDSYVPIGSTRLAEVAGLEPQAAVNAWGGPVEASNAVDSSWVMPFSMALRTATPWGDTISMRALSAP
jgi:hypothetical protein